LQFDYTVEVKGGGRGGEAVVTPGKRVSTPGRKEKYILMALLQISNDVTFHANSYYGSSVGASISAGLREIPKYLSSPLPQQL